MLTWIILGIFISFMVFWAYYSRNATVQTISLMEDEAVEYGFVRLRITSFGRGGEQTTFPNCSLTITNDRIIIDQKIPLSNKKRRIHYYLWFTNDLDGIFEIDGGITNLGINKNSFSEKEGKLQITPINAGLIRRLEIPLPLNKILPYLPEGF